MNSCPTRWARDILASTAAAPPAGKVVEAVDRVEVVEVVTAASWPVTESAAGGRPASAALGVTVIGVRPTDVGPTPTATTTAAARQKDTRGTGRRWRAGRVKRVMGIMGVMGVIASDGATRMR
jgi:hypothetical protein